VFVVVVVVVVGGVVGEGWGVGGGGGGGVGGWSHAPVIIPSFLVHKESRLKNMTEKYIFSDHSTPCLYVTFRSHVLHLLLPAV